MRTQLARGILSCADAATASGGELVSTTIGRCFSNVCTDSREADSQSLFVAIAGERVDGHSFIGSVVKNGCRAVLCERIPDECASLDCDFIVVSDSVKAIGDIASFYCKNFEVKTVAVTGSVGKTTTKEFVSAVLSRKFKNYKTEGNHNSVIGLPMSLFEISGESESAVLEMGMSGFGEIGHMSRVSEPSVALVTNIGTSHMEMLGSRENICRAKMEILEGLRDGGTLVLNGDEPLLTEYDCGAVKPIFVGINNRNADLRALNVRCEATKTTFDLIADGKVIPNVELPVMGNHYVYAALFAFAAGRLLGMDDEEIRAGLLDFKNVGMRQNIYELEGLTVIEDCYNASPESMRSGIDVLSQLAKQKGGRMVAVLGDMLELGEKSPELHRSVGSYLASKGGRALFTFGERASEIAAAAVKGGLAQESVYVNRDKDRPDITGEMLLHGLKEGDVVLFKASRSMALERIIAYLRENSSRLNKN